MFKTKTLKSIQKFWGVKKSAFIKKLCCNFSSNTKKKNTSTKNLPSDIINKKSKQIENTNTPSFEKELEQWNATDLLNYLEKRIPLKFDKKHFIKSDQNLTSFVPLDKVINKIKAVAITKNYLENLINILNFNVDSEFDILTNFCDENLVNKMNMNLQHLLNLKKDVNANLKYKIIFKSDTGGNREASLKKINFNINLFNVKNYIFLGTDPSRKSIKNLKFISHNRDIFIDNPMGDENSTSSIKTDIVSYRETYKLGLENYDKIPFTLISQFEFTAIPTKKLTMNISIEDELNEKTTSQNFVINGIDFIVECQILKMTLSEINKLEQELRKQYNNEDSTALDENQNEILKMQQTNLKILNFLESQEFQNKFKYDLKIIDVENYLNGNEII